ncbi:MAG: radical SAM protein [Thermodesulfobacteriota bacterium]
MTAAVLLRVSELFYSIQGESTYAGYPCAFIRLAGCNLRCAYCDARYTYEEEGQEKRLDELLAFVDTHPAALVQITGGEPLLQEGIYPLMAALLRRQRLVLLETNGSRSLTQVPTGVVKVMDLKCPESGMAGTTLPDNFRLLTPADEVKCVVSSRADYDWAVAELRRHFPDLRQPGTLRQRPKLLFSPVADRLSLATLASWLLADGLSLRLQAQLHKILWPTESRGV